MPLNKGEYTYGDPILRGHHNTVNIGKFCSIGENCIFDCGFDHNYKFVSTYPFDVQLFMPELPPNRPSVRDINIGNDVWFGENCMIMNGVTIGDGAVLGARTIVTKDVEPYSIVVGASVCKGYRFNLQQRNRLLEIKWWDWPIEKIKEHAHLLMSENVQAFLNHVKMNELISVAESQGQPYHERL